jgi:hypothetical protein
MKCQLSFEKSGHLQTHKVMLTSWWDLPLVIRSNARLHVRSDKKIHSKNFNISNGRVWGTCEGRIAKRLPKPDFISRW